MEKDASRALSSTLKSQTMELKITSLTVIGAESKLDRNYVPFAVYIIQVERQHQKSKEIERYQTQRRFNQFHELDTEVKKKMSAKMCGNVRKLFFMTILFKKI